MTSGFMAATLTPDAPAATPRSAASGQKRAMETDSTEIEQPQDDNEEDRRHAYKVEWEDGVSGLTMALTLLHWPHHNEVELIDPKKRKTYLKRVRCDGIGAAPLRPGSSVVVMSRRLQILSPADAATRSALAAALATSRTFAMVKPDALQHLGEVLAAADAAGLAVINLRLARLSPQEAAQFYAVHRQRPFFPNLLEFMTSGPVVALELEGADAVPAWRRLLGPTDSGAARVQAPQSLRARLGSDNTRNACHGSDAADTAAQEAAFFFGRQAAGRLALPPATDVTLAVIKPHAVAAGLPGPIIEALQSRLHILAAEGVRLSPSRAEKLHAVYKGVVPAATYEAMVQELSSGLAMALALTWRPGSGAPPREGNLVDALRDLAGPADPEIGRAAAPGSLRARYGVAGARNALHVTDLQQDGQPEAGFLFGG